MLANLIQSYNEKIPYDDGKIFSTNGGNTSVLMQKLSSHGYRCTTSGIMHYLYDDKGVKVTSAYSWEGLLFNTAIVMR